MAKCWSWGFYIPKVHPLPNKKNVKKPTCQKIAFSLNTNKHISTPKIVHSKSPIQGHDPKFLFPHRYRTVPSVYDKDTSKWSSNAQLWSKYELYTSKPSQLHETVQQKCSCKISYGSSLALVRHQTSMPAMFVLTLDSS